MELGNKLLGCFVVLIGLSSLSVCVHACTMDDIKTTVKYDADINKFQLVLTNGCNCDVENVTVMLKEASTKKKKLRRTKDLCVNGGGIIKAGEVLRSLIDDPFPGGPQSFEVQTVTMECDCR
ncbi:hypothetical protein SUGI_0381700 [Cryptomeria japonica]|nr:hypothetical protein SUGI_0381700 [Cryptomeria japonica]